MEFGQDLGDVRRSRPELHEERVRILLTHVRPERLDPGPIRRRSPRLPATTPENPSAPTLRAARELIDQASLSDPRFAADQEESSSPRQRIAETRFEFREFALAAHEDVRLLSAGGHPSLDAAHVCTRKVRLVLAPTFCTPSFSR